MTYEELGKLAKQKYPQYQKIPDAELGQKLAEKYPQYKSKITDKAQTGSTKIGQPQPKAKPTTLEGKARELPGIKQLGAFGDFQSGMAMGALKGVGSTIRGLLGLSEKITQKTIDPLSKKLTTTIQGKPLSQAQEASYNDAMFQGEKPGFLKTKGVGEKVGFGVEQVGEFFVPGGAVTKANKAVAGTKALTKLGQAGKAGKLGAGSLKLLARGGLEAGSAASVTAAQGGDVKTAAIVGGALPFVGKTLGLLGSAAKSTSKFISSSLSGVPEAAIEQAFKNPTAVRAAITRAAQEGGESAAKRINQTAIKALQSLKSARSEVYERGLANLNKEVRTTKAGQLYVKKVVTEYDVKAGLAAKSALGKTSWVPTDLTTSGLKNVTTKTLKEFGAKAKGQVIDFSEVAMDSSHAKKLQEIVDRVYGWKNISPTGLNKLTQIIDGYKLGGVNLGTSEKSFNAIIGKMRTNLSEYVGQRIPQIRELRKGYASQSEVIDSIVKELKLGRGDPNTALRKLLNVFNPKSQVYRPIVEELGEKAGVDLMSDIAGLTMAQWTPQGLGKYLATLFGGIGSGLSIAAPQALLSLPAIGAMSSPRLIGKTVTRLGQMAPGSKTFTKLGGRAIKAGITKGFSDR